MGSRISANINYTDSNENRKNILGVALVISDCYNTAINNVNILRNNMKIILLSCQIV